MGRWQAATGIPVASELGIPGGGAPYADAAAPPRCMSRWGNGLGVREEWSLANPSREDRGDDLCLGVSPAYSTQVSHPFVHYLSASGLRVVCKAGEGGGPFTHCGTAQTKIPSVLEINTLIWKSGWP